MSDLAAWLAACADEDETRARAAAPEWDDEDHLAEWNDLPDASFAHARYLSPAHALREVAFKRKLLALAAGADDIHYGRCAEVGADLPGVLIGERIRQALAEVYEDRPGYGQFAEMTRRQEA